jgi:hypothetical protein
MYTTTRITKRETDLLCQFMYAGIRTVSETRATTSSYRSLGTHLFHFRLMKLSFQHALPGHLDWDDIGQLSR